MELPENAKLGRPLYSYEMKDMKMDLKNKMWLKFKVPCFPLYSIIKAVGEFRSIDFLSLDVEGSEIDILMQFPFEKIPIKIGSVFNHYFPVVFVIGYHLIRRLKILKIAGRCCRKLI